ncbi:hypothetical protein CDL15_Pgr006771 [Punica granatum]|uniref:Uncharacterized protein n=1 Tax=Punica granatum TaxID=22663 RepID=A0A218X8A1_PUNGR|nr:hypothetical protein CDL15_Pgr006771 [Punica granatum]PKI50659.1 hypothetical protein CRG98_028971 [Punica granatum]
MGSKGRSHHWSVFDGVNSFPSTPEALMAEINAATADLEYARATALLQSPPASAPRSRGYDAEAAKYDVRVADEAYRAGCAALAAGKLDEALQSLHIALSKCPPDKTSAIAKLQSLISLTSDQLRKSPI